ncbi:hypothetical protein POX_g08590 [Penicillium oxalicum]|uniref:hypothetical protein n=1 Tax=Penicillium oxalicum TaxID=69781 RepID=UPI0020B68937|nr:hypothetical protein POX_g08590 [Penicillium oxalicum]KAI2786208.1 hypothetical protein POX_g08590 [Penicillium oxalicum]
MNWTGGQLHRHLTRPGNLTQAQKQHFFRSRQQPVHDGMTRLLSNNGSNLDTRDGERQDNGIATVDGNNLEQGRTGEASCDKVSTSTLPSNSSSRVEQARHLETLKRRLLEDPDWAAVTVARPLEIQFASKQEIERFGKRRKLSDNDRHRLLTAHANERQWTVPFLESPFMRGKEPSSDQIQDSITRQPFGDGIQITHNQLRPGHERGSKRQPDTSSPPKSGLLTDTNDNPKSIPDQNTSWTAGPVVTSAAAPDICKSRSIGDWGIMRDTPPYSDLRQLHRSLSGVSCSPTEILPVSSGLNASESLLTSDTQSWLPQPVRRKSPSSSLVSRVRATASLSPFHRALERSWETLPPLSGDSHPPAAVEFFGQQLRMRSIDETDSP